MQTLIIAEIGLTLLVSSCSCHCLIGKDSIQRLAVFAG